MSAGRGRDERVNPRTKAAGTCPVCRKRIYATKQEARAAGRRLGLLAKGTVYRMHDSGWHITSHPQGGQHE